MKDLSSYLGESRIKELAKHPRPKAIDFLYERINYERLRDGNKAWPKRLIAIKTAHCGLDDLDYLCKQVGQSSNPGKVFWGCLKVKIKNENT